MFTVFTVMDTKFWQAVVATWLLLNLLLVGAFDIYVTFKFGPEASVSYQMWLWSRRMPILPFFVGLLCGHLFWRSYANGG